MKCVPAVAWLRKSSHCTAFSSSAKSDCRVNLVPNSEWRLSIAHRAVVGANNGRKGSRTAAMGRTGNPDLRPGAHFLIQPNTEITMAAAPALCSRETKCSAMPNQQTSIEPVIRRDEILALLRDRQDEIAKRFRAHGLALFGSGARDELRPDSDVDVIVDFDGPASFDTYFALKDYLEALFGRRVDLVSGRGLKKRARQHVEQDLIRVT